MPLEFAQDFEEILVVEEKQPIVEGQIKSALYNQSSDRRPRVIGKTLPNGERLLPATLEFSPLQVAIALAGRLDPVSGSAVRPAAQRARRRRGCGCVGSLLAAQAVFLLRLPPQHFNPYA